MVFDMSTTQTWDPNTYAKNARFVSDLGLPVLELLSPRPGERILDLGCGDGALTKKLAELGCEVVAVDSSAPQVEAARRLGIEAYVMNGEELQYQEEFDAVFSNAVLHWIRRADAVTEGVFRCLRPGGRFVAECGGHGCVNKIRTALVHALNRRGIDGESRVPWSFPTPGEYATRLEQSRETLLTQIEQTIAQQVGSRLRRNRKQCIPARAFRLRQHFRRDVVDGIALD